LTLDIPDGGGYLVWDHYSFKEEKKLRSCDNYLDKQRIQNIKILLKDVKEPGAAMQMRAAKTVSDKAGRTKPYPSGYARSSLFKPRWVDIAWFYRTVQKLLPYHHHAAITG